MGSSSSTAASPELTTMGAVATAARIAEEVEKKPCKPCCACPETKQARDACIVENGEENCKDLIQAHVECMRKMGFNI